MVAHGTRRLSCRTAEHRKLDSKMQEKEKEKKNKLPANSDVAFLDLQCFYRKVLWPDRVTLLDSKGFTTAYSFGGKMPSSLTHEEAIKTVLSKKKIRCCMKTSVERV